LGWEFPHFKIGWGVHSMMSSALIWGVGDMAGREHKNPKARWPLLNLENWDKDIMGFLSFAGE
jgi:hypothetical protein